jgi:hypothetical protein
LITGFIQINFNNKIKDFVQTACDYVKALDLSDIVNDSNAMNLYFKVEYEDKDGDSSFDNSDYFKFILGFKQGSCTP